MLKNVFQVPKENTTNHIVVRQTRFVLYFILSIIFLYVLLLWWVFIWYISIDSWFQEDWFMSYLVFANVLLIILLRMILITRLIKYFYSLVIITPLRIIHINYWLLFKESIRIVNLQRNISITSSQKWFIQAVCNFWNIVMRNANQTELILEKIPRPKYVAKKIDELCKKQS